MGWIDLIPQAITAAGAIGGTLAGAIVVRAGGKAATRRTWMIEMMREQKDYCAEVLFAASQQKETLNEIVVGFKAAVDQIFKAAVKAVAEAAPEGSESFRVSAKHTLPTDLASRLGKANRDWKFVFARRIMNTSSEVEFVIGAVDRSRNEVAHMLNVGRPDLAGNLLDDFDLKVQLLEDLLKIEQVESMNEVRIELRSGRAGRAKNREAEADMKREREKLSPILQAIKDES